MNTMSISLAMCAVDFSSTSMSPEDQAIAERIAELKKQKEYLQFQCRKAGQAIIELNVKNEQLVKEIDKIKKNYVILFLNLSFSSSQFLNPSRY